MKVIFSCAGGTAIGVLFGVDGEGDAGFGVTAGEVVGDVGLACGVTLDGDGGVGFATLVDGEADGVGFGVGAGM